MKRENELREPSEVMQAAKLKLAKTCIWSVSSDNSNQDGILVGNQLEIHRQQDDAK